MKSRINSLMEVVVFHQHLNVQVLQHDVFTQIKTQSFNILEGKENRSMQMIIFNIYIHVFTPLHSLAIIFLKLYLKPLHSNACIYQ